ncbi:peptide deformylase [Patescibacteria group bacterium]|nr:peptide deformylase [Patescibacteria group bacterium]
MLQKRFDFVRPDDPVLVKTAKVIGLGQIKSPEIDIDIERMLKAAYGEQEDRSKPVLVGLAAPQIGISKRIILVDVAANGKGEIGDLRVYINPEVVWKSKDEREWYEGCYSTDRVCGIVSRPNKVRIKACTREGLQVEEEYEGYTARIFQHEIDHLNGAEFVSRIIDDDKLHWVEESEFPQYRDKESWRNWQKKCSRDKWNKIKGLSSE